MPVLMSICDRPLLPIYGAYDAHGLRLLLNGISTFERSTLVDTPGPVPAKTTLAAQNELETPAQTSAAEVAKALAPAEPKRLSLADLREAGRRRREAAIQVTNELRSAPAE